MSSDPNELRHVLKVNCTYKIPSRVGLPYGGRYAMFVGESTANFHFRLRTDANGIHEVEFVINKKVGDGYFVVNS
jgi:hypothetical protein